jgi:hypothetical protein
MFVIVSPHRFNKIYPKTCTPSLFAAAFRRRLHLRLPADLGFLEESVGFGCAAASGGRTLSRAGFDSRVRTVYLLFVCCCGPADRLPRAMRLPNSKRRPKPDRRALELLASCRDGCTEALCAPGSRPRSPSALP